MSKIVIDDLRRACMCLFLEVPETIAEDVKKKAEAVIAELQDMEHYYDCMEAAGVHNWEGYDHAMGAYNG